MIADTKFGRPRTNNNPNFCFSYFSGVSYPSISRSQQLFCRSERFSIPPNAWRTIWFYLFFSKINDNFQAFFHWMENLSFFLRFQPVLIALKNF